MDPESAQVDPGGAQVDPKRAQADFPKKWGWGREPDWPMLFPMASTRGTKISNQVALGLALRWLGVGLGLFWFRLGCLRVGLRSEWAGKSIKH